MHGAVFALSSRVASTLSHLLTATADATDFSDWSSFALVDPLVSTSLPFIGVQVVVFLMSCVQGMAILCHMPSQEEFCLI